MFSSNRALAVVCALGVILPSHAAYGDQFTWTGGAGSTVWADPANWVNVTPGGTATFPDADDNAAFYANHQVTNGAAANLTNSGTTWIGPGSVTVNDGVILNHGLLTYVGAAGDDDENLVINNSVLLTGAGTLQLTSGSRSIVRSNSDMQLDPFNIRDVLTNDIHHTIRGAGQINVRLINRGIISADVQNQSLRLFSNDAGLGITFSTFENRGRIEAIGGGLLSLSTIALDNRNGTILIDAPGTMSARDSEVYGGVLIGSAVSGPGPSLAALLRDVELRGKWQSGSGIRMIGSIQNNSVLTISGEGMNLIDIVTLDGSGELVLASAIRPTQATSSPVSPVNVLINGPQHTIRSGNAANTSMIQTDFINRGRIVAQTFGTSLATATSPSLILGTTNISIAGSTNQGEIRALRNSYLSLSTRLDNTRGTIVLEDGARLMQQVGTLFGGTISGGQQVGSYLHCGNVNAFIGDITLSGKLFSGGDFSARFFGRITNHGSLTTSELKINKVVTFDGTGEVYFRSQGSVYSAIETNTLLARVINTGGHTIRGNASFNVSLVNEARLQPGTMSVAGLTLAATSQLIMSPRSLDQFASLSARAPQNAINLDGELIVDFQGIYLVGTRTFDIISAEVISGDFSSLSFVSPNLPWIGSVSYEIIRDVTEALDVVRLTINNGVSGLAGDFNNDGFVDARDYTLWRDQRYTVAFVANDSTPETFDEADYTVWAANFGRSWLGAPATPVPEAQAGLIVLLAIAAIACKSAGRR